MNNSLEHIVGGKKLLFVVSHFDDVEDYWGGMILKGLAEGIINPNNINYLVCSNSDKGGRDKYTDPTELSKLRVVEQEKVFKHLGIPLGNLHTLDYDDGFLYDQNEELLERIVFYVRLIRPDLVLTHTFENKTIETKRGTYYVHRDHRVVGETTLDAVYPYTRDLIFFPEHFENGVEQGHTVKEVITAESDAPNLFIDITNQFDDKIELISQFETQIDSKDSLRTYLEVHNLDENGRYTEKFKYIKLAV